MSVNKEYKALLSNKINQLWYQGYVTFERWELLSWYDRDRITNVVWRDINEAWADCFTNGSPSPLQVIKCDDSTSPQKFVVVNTASLTDIEDLA